MYPPHRYAVAGPHRVDLEHPLTLARWKEHPLPTDAVMVLASDYDDLIERLRALTTAYFQTGDVEAARLFRAQLQELKLIVDLHPLPEDLAEKGQK